MLDLKAEGKGLPGLLPVREALGFDRQKVGKLGDVSAEFVRRLELGISDCSAACERLLAYNLGCERSDLTGTPRPSLLARFESERLKREAAEARAKADAADKRAAELIKAVGQ